jgi:quinol monooxygenase YgiN
MVHVLAVITAKPGQRAAVLEVFHANVPAVLAEDGCIAYDAVIDVPNFGPVQTPFGPDTFVVIEQWQTPDALRAHGGSPHMAAYAAKVKEMLADRRIHVLETA